MEDFVIGSRIHSILYGGRDGIIYAIHGAQSPASVRSIFGGAMQSGGRAEFDVVFLNGTESLRLPECIIRGVQWRILPGIATADEIATARAFASAELTRRTEEAAAAALAFTNAVDALRTDPRFSKLQQAGTHSGGGKLVAINLRVELKAAFPGVKFAITSDYDSVNVRWTDGPTTAQVEAITTRYRAGSFDSMTDSYEFRRNPFTEVFGSAKYIFEKRRHTLAALEDAAALVAKRFGLTPFQVVPSTCDPGTGSLGNHHNDYQRYVYDCLERRHDFVDVPAPATLAAA